jgi:UDP-N-acetylglucosamine 1-carboxyvinyltransferase
VPSPLSMVVHGGRPLDGQVPVSGYKHALTVLIAAAIAMDLPVTVLNVPDITESAVLARILDHMGAGGGLAGGVWTLDPRPMRSRPVPARLSGLIHGSLYLVPALLARFGEVSFVDAGGDRIGPAELAGSRPTDQVAAVLERFGATVGTTGGLHAKARRLRACSIDLMDFSTDPLRLRGPRASSATKTAMILAAVADGTTMLRHPVDRDATWELGDFLRSCGATLSREDDTWCVQSGTSRSPVEHRLISDSTGIVTYIACAVRTGGSLKLTGLTADRTRRAIGSELRVLADMGVPLTWGPDWLSVHRAEELSPVRLEIECNGFSTDAHPILAVPLLDARGVSRITDHVWTNRFSYVRVLTEMGARAEVTGNTVELHRSRLRPAEGPLFPTDSRAAAAAVVAALGVDGATRIVDVGHLDRSYELLIERLRAVGASIDAGTSTEGA